MGRLTRRAFPTLFAWRDDAQLSQAEAGAQVGITQAHWSRLESGGVASAQLAKRLSKMTGVSIETLLGLAESDSGVNDGTQPKEYTDNTKEKPYV